jgi:positive regulator of sigma E activity
MPARQCGGTRQALLHTQPGCRAVCIDATASVRSGGPHEHAPLEPNSALIEGQARVVAVDGPSLAGWPRNPAACGSCATSSACGPGSTATHAASQWRAPRTLGHGPGAVGMGDTVRIGVDRNALTRAAWAAYALPLVAMLAAAGALQDAGDGAAIAAAAVAGLLLGARWLGCWCGAGAMRWNQWCWGGLPTRLTLHAVPPCRAGAAPGRHSRDSPTEAVMQDLLLVLLGTAIVNNVVLAKFLGLCPFMGTSTRIDTALGMGLATTFGADLVHRPGVGRGRAGCWHRWVGLPAHPDLHPGHRGGGAVHRDGDPPHLATACTRRWACTCRSSPPTARCWAWRC